MNFVFQKLEKIFEAIYESLPHFSNKKTFMCIVCQSLGSIDLYKLGLTLHPIKIIDTDKSCKQIKCTGGSRLMPISLLRISLLWISLLRFFTKIHKFTLCICSTYVNFVWLLQFFGLFLANANFFQNQKLH